MKSSLLWQIISGTSESNIVLYIIAAQFWDLRAQIIAADGYCVRLDLHSLTKETSCSSQLGKIFHREVCVVKQTKKDRWFGMVGSIYPIPLIFSNYRLFRSLEHFLRKKRLTSATVVRIATSLRSSIFIRDGKANAQVDESYKQSLRLYFLSE